ncbi:MAG: winged helix-turn-helix domain-containing protein [Rhodobiaceae bacterium]|nr:winged helix-turn-helix domain-containing protein [Rhodobiaceae bacterium]
MLFHFADYQLDPDAFELRRDGAPVSLEPQVLQLLLYLVQNRDRMVSKDELVDAIWSGRAISDANISSRISLARSAIGDNGVRQELIRTVHGRGFRFVAPVDEVSGEIPARAGAEPPAPAEPGPEPSSKPSIAVLPFRAIGFDVERAVVADAISHDIIQAISRLRWLTVIARGSSFRFRGADLDLPDVATTLNVRYVLTGLVETEGNRLSATLELADGKTAAIIWADRLVMPLDSVQELRAAIVNQLVAALDAYIPLNEAMAARLGSTEQLDAWASYHLGLHHMYRFSREDNARATALFERAISLDPKFARAHAGLSFTRFQDSFMRYEGSADGMAAMARRHAERGLELDPLDPFVNFTMGRTFWLTDEPMAAAQWLDRAIELNPNYAQGFYARAFTAMLVGDLETVEADTDCAVNLSPLDPLLYGMYGARSLALMQVGRHAEAADWADRAASAPGAHFLIAMIALVANGLAGREAQAQHWLGVARRQRPDVNGQHFFAAFPIHNAEARHTIEAEINRHGL